MGLELLTQALLITRASAVIGKHRALANVIGGNHVWQVWRRCLGDISIICIKQETDEHFDLCDKADLDSRFVGFFSFFFTIRSGYPSLQLAEGARSRSNVARLLQFELDLLRWCWGWMQPLKMGCGHPQPAPRRYPSTQERFCYGGWRVQLHESEFCASSRSQCRSLSLRQDNAVTFMAQRGWGENTCEDVKCTFPPLPTRR